MMDPRQIKLTALHEGYRQFVYDDATGKPLGPGDVIVGYPTVGYGLNLVGRGVLKSEAEYLLERELESIYVELDKDYAWFKGLSPARQAVLADMRFNLGREGLAKFRQTLSHVQMGRFKDARDSMLQSKWAGQVKGRALTLSTMMETGEWPSKLG